MRPGRRSDRGESLLELLVTISIMSVAVVAIVGAIATSARLSDVHRQQTIGRGYLTAFAATVEARIALPATGYLACTNPDGSAYDGLYTAPSGYSDDVVKVEYWIGSTFGVTGCTAANDSGVQRLTLRIWRSAGGVDMSIQIIIRKPCRPGDTPACS
jgi:type II secretory pathway pseudopilin PulG